MSAAVLKNIVNTRVAKYARSLYGLLIFSCSCIDVCNVLLGTV